VNFMNFLVKLHEVCRVREVDEVFVKLKEIENPGHPYDFVKVWVAGRPGGGSDQNE
jgi:hypothetical protein